MVYTSASLALAALEMLVHFDVAETPSDLVAVPANVPESVAIKRVAPSELPSTWQRHPPPAELAESGREWIRAAHTAVLAVPSVIIPQEVNFLLNPRHREFRRIRVGEPQPFRFDLRLWKAR